MVILFDLELSYNYLPFDLELSYNYLPVTLSSATAALKTPKIPSI